MSLHDIICRTCRTELAIDYELTHARTSIIYGSEGKRYFFDGIEVDEKQLIEDSFEYKTGTITCPNCKTVGNFMKKSIQCNIGVPYSKQLDTYDKADPDVRRQTEWVCRQKNWNPRDFLDESFYDGSRE